MSQDPQTGPHPADWDASTLMAAYRAGRISPVEAIRDTLARIARLDPIYNAYVLVDTERALDAARASEQRWLAGAPCGPLDGVPVSIKDAIAVKDWPTRNGSRATSIAPETKDAPIVAFLREAGAVILGKTALPEFGFKSTTDSLLSGATRNPWDTRLTPGGSSGGAAAAATAGMGILHVGTDGGGSIRQPASFCGVVGFKPSSGRVPNVPIGLYRSILCTGPIARSVQDCAMLLSVLAREDRRDPFCLPTLQGDLDGALARDSLAGVRIAYIPALDVAVDPEVSAAVDRAARLLEELGAVITIYRPSWAWLRTVISRIVECHKDHNVAQFPAAQQALIDPDYLKMAELGRRHSAREYIEALAGMDRFATEMAELDRQFDALLTPTMPILPFELFDRKPGGFDVVDWYDLESFLYPFNLSGQPAVSLPCGLSRDGRPIGLQMIASRMDDIRLLSMASAFQNASGGPLCLPGR